jgi:hypothetical protein
MNNTITNARTTVAPASATHSSGLRTNAPSPTTPHTDRSQLGTQRRTPRNRNTAVLPISGDVSGDDGRGGVSIGVVADDGVPDPDPATGGVIAPSIRSGTSELRSPPPRVVEAAGDSASAAGKPDLLRGDTGYWLQPR